MLSKSQAKAFFLVGTILCSAAFVGLTVDSIQKIPGQTHQENMTPAVIRGKHLFDKNNCMGCHTILGEGAYYAPELTKVYTRRGEAFIKAMLKDPEAMYPGQRKMVNYHFDDQQIDDLTAFLKWIGEMDLNGFPPEPDLLQLASPSTGAALIQRSNRPAVFNQMCIACHSLGGQGGKVGPALDGIGAQRDAAFLKAWLTDPSQIKKDAKMPKLPLSAADIVELQAFLSTLKEAQK